MLVVLQHPRGKGRGYCSTTAFYLHNGIEYFVVNRFLILRVCAYQLRISWVESFSSVPAALASFTGVTVTHLVYASLWTVKMNLTNSGTLSSDSSPRQP